MLKISCTKWGKSSPNLSFLTIINFRPIKWLTSSMITPHTKRVDHRSDGN
jgi:hypothetical protein